MTLIEARALRNLTQQKLEDASGVDRTRIAKMEADPEHANPTVDTVRKLEDALKLRRGTLVFGADVRLVAEAQAS